jgi:hypothetical protein
MSMSEDANPGTPRGRLNGGATNPTAPATGPNGDGASVAPDDGPARVLALEGEVRRLRALLEVRNDAFRALMARLVAVELRAQASECDRLRKERDDAVALATVLENLKIYRYTRWPRAVYGKLLGLRRALGR